MCGIIGGNLYNKNGIKLGLEKIIHRGRDASSYYETNGFYIGHNRLSIQDLSEKANQPMVSDCGNYYQLIQKFKTKTVTHEQLQMIRIKPGKAVSADCPNSNWSSANQADIRDGWIYTSFKTGQLFINYQGALENADGELLVVDHPLINEYYEYAIKQRILENMYMNGENVVQQMNLVEGRLRGARNNALSLVNTPNFGELKKIWEMNRKAQYHKYVNMFKS